MDLSHCVGGTGLASRGLKNMRLGICIGVLSMLVFGNAFALNLKSKAFDNKEYIPQKYTCEGENVSPPLQWTDVPSKVKSFVLICDDPDAPMGVWVHWVIFNIPANITNLEEGVLPENSASEGIICGINDFGNIGYGGPCPPSGLAHRYFFKLYALDSLLSLKEGILKQQVLSAMDGHIIAQAELIGLFSR